MDYNDKVAFIAAMLVSARIQRGMAPDANTVRDAVKTAKAICEAAAD